MKTDQRGSILLVFIITLPFLILIATYYMSLSLTSFQVARQDQLHTEAQLAADAGADYSVEQISQDNTWTGTGSEVTLHSDSKFKTTYTSTVTSGTNTKTLAVTGKTYWPANATTASRSVKIYVDLRPVTSGNYSVVTGEGGLFMSNNSKVVGGGVFVNGEISLSNSAQIGLSTSPATVNVADQICPQPADATYPRVCNVGEGGQPITFSGNSHIYGTVTATHQTSGSNMSNPGLVAGTVAPQPLPTYDRDAQKAAVTNNMTSSAASCSGSQNVIWPANTKITGNVSLSTTCTVTIKGNVWITGNLDLANSSQIKVDDALGATRPNLMVDGSTGAHFINNTQITPNSSGTGIELYTFYSRAGCSPDCSSVTGTDLASSRAVSTIKLDNASSAANTIFYAYWSQVQINNSGSIGALIGQTIQMTNNSAVTFSASAGVGTTVWIVKGYRRQ